MHSSTFIKIKFYETPISVSENRSRLCQLVPSECSIPLRSSTLLEIVESKYDACKPNQSSKKYKNELLPIPNVGLSLLI